MQLKEILTALETIAPLTHAEAWDNVGLIAGDPAADITRIVLAIDYTPAVSAEARRANCDLIIAYHPPLFSAIKRVTADGPMGLIHDAIRDGVAIYSPHTAWDAAEGGTNDLLADALGLADRQPLRVVAPSFNPTVSAAPPPGIGHGRIGNLHEPATISDLCQRIKQQLHLETLLVAGEVDRSVTRIAVCAGAGGELLADAMVHGAQLYLTGELRHHDALKAMGAGMTCICTLHSNSERPSLMRLMSRLKQVLLEHPGNGALPEMMLSHSDRDPFAFR